MVGEGSVCFLRSQKGICPAPLNNRITIRIYKVTAIPSRHRPVPVPLLRLGFGGSSIRNIMMLLFQAPSFPIKLMPSEPNMIVCI